MHSGAVAEQAAALPVYFISCAADVRSEMHGRPACAFARSRLFWGSLSPNEADELQA